MIKKHGIVCTYKAKPYHQGAIRHLLENPASGLLMDPGTGKTGCVLAAFTILKKKKLVDKMLVIAPLLPVTEVWPPENEKWGFGFEMSVIHGSPKKKIEAATADADIYLINYEAMDWLSDNLHLMQKPGERWWIVFDESTKIKHTNTKRFKLLRPLLNRFGRRTILTGTPAPNGLMDLFGQVYVVDLGERLGRYVTAYRREYFYPTGYGGYSWVLQEDGEKRIYKKLDGLFYRVSDEVLNLPPRHDVPIYVTLPPKAMKVYKTLEDEFVAEVKSGLITAVNSGVKSMKLRQIANGCVYGEKGVIDVHAEKIEAFKDLVDQLQGNPILIGYEFTADGQRLAKALGNAPMIYGETKKAERKALLAKFNKGGYPALVVNSAVVGYGLNLQEACHTIGLFGLTWNLEVYIQFAKRVHRGGQSKTVMIHHVTARNTIDELVWQMLKRKDKRQNAFMDAVKQRYL